ncbi:holothin acyltransferase-like [Glandiceps talaboti]
MSHLLIRVASKEDMKAVSELTIAEGWGYSADYIETIRQVNPDGFFLAFKGSELVGTAYAFNHTDDLTFFGMSITKQGHRKQGIQRRLFEQRFDHAGDRNVCLNSGDEYRRDVNVKIGFKHIDFETKLINGQVDHSLVPTINTPSGVKITQLDEVQFNDITEYDKGINQFNRAEFLQIWLQGKNVYSFVALEKGMGKNGRVVGYVSARLLEEEFAISPLYADNVAIADSLLRTVLLSLPNSCTVRLVVPTGNKVTLELARKHHIDKVLFTCTRQFTKKIIEVPQHKIFSIVALESMLA